MHFFNPAPIMKLVEVVSTVDHRRRRHRDHPRAVRRRSARSPVSCGDRAGFIVNALLFPYLNDAVKMLEAHYATADDIDTAMKQGCALPMGPFELLDVVGNDVSLAIQRELYLEFREPGFAPGAAARAPGHRGLPRSQDQARLPRLQRALTGGRHRRGLRRRGLRRTPDHRLVVAQDLHLPGLSRADPARDPARGRVAGAAHHLRPGRDRRRRAAALAHAVLDRARTPPLTRRLDSVEWCVVPSSSALASRPSSARCSPRRRPVRTAAAGAARPGGAAAGSTRTYYQVGEPRSAVGIVHVVAPERGARRPGATTLYASRQTRAQTPALETSGSGPPRRPEARSGSG